MGYEMKLGSSRREYLKGIVGLAGAGSLAGCTFTAGALDSSMASVTGVDELMMFKGAPAHGEYPAEETQFEMEMPGGHMEMEAVTIRMTAATDDSNNYHFMPHVAWVEPGQTVFWEHFSKEGISERRTHTITSFGSAGKYMRMIPEAANHFDSGYRAGTHGIDQDELIDERYNREMAEQIGQEGGFSREFQEEGVYFYYCQPHHQYKMAGAVVVGELWGDGGTEAVSNPSGWSPAMTSDGDRLADLDQMHGPALRDQVHELQEMVHSGGDMEDGGH